MPLLPGRGWLIGHRDARTGVRVRLPAVQPASRRRPQRGRQAHANQEAQLGLGCDVHGEYRVRVYCREILSYLSLIGGG